MNQPVLGDSSHASAGWVLRYLLDRGVLDAADAVGAAPMAEDISVSHQAYRVWVGGTPRWFVKRADPIRSQGRDLGVEGAVYRLASQHPVLADVVPRCWLVGDRDEVVVLDALPAAPLNAAELWGHGSAPSRHAMLRAYGGAVARAHHVRPPRFGQPPWLLSALEPRWGQYAWLPPLCAALLMRVAASPFCRAAFRQARREWRESALVHGDLRWTNALGQSSSRGARVWLVDWELACLGDPAWDVGSLLADIVSVSALGSIDGDDLWQQCVLVLAGYYEQAPAGIALEWGSLLRRSTRLAGVRLVQTLVEHAHGSSSEELQIVEAALAPWVVGLLAQSRAVGDALAGEVARAA